MNRSSSKRKQNIWWQEQTGSKDNTLFPCEKWEEQSFLTKQVQTRILFQNHYYIINVHPRTPGKKNILTCGGTVSCERKLTEKGEIKCKALFKDFVFHVFLFLQGMKKIVSLRKFIKLRIFKSYEGRGKSGLEIFKIEDFHWPKILRIYNFQNGFVKNQCRL